MTDNGKPATKPSIDELRADIKQTRAELGETVQALAAKADVKARAKDQVELTKQRVKAQAAEATGKVREAAAAATGKVRSAAAQTADKVRDSGNGGDSDQPRPAAAVAVQVRERVQSSPVPPVLLVAGVLAIVGIVLIVRGRRR